MNAGWVTVMKRIEVDLKCMQLEIGTKKLGCKGEEKKRKICRRR